MYHCLAIARARNISADDRLNGFGQYQIDRRQIDRDNDDNNNDHKSRCVSLLTRRPIDLLQFLPCFLEELGAVPGTVLDGLDPITHAAIHEMAGQAGLEPTTTGFGVRRSTNWSY